MKKYTEKTEMELMGILAEAENDDNAIHDEDSFCPNEICDAGRPLTDDEAEIESIICDTMDELEEAGKSEEATVTLPKKHVLNALQLLRAFTCRFDITLEDYEYDYTD